MPNSKNAQQGNTEPAAALPVPPAEVQKTVKDQLPGFAEEFEEHGHQLAGAIVGEPVPVSHLAGEEQDYYLVPIFLEPPLPHFVARVAAREGDLLSLEGTSASKPGGESWIYAVLSNEKLQERMAGAQKKYVPGSWQPTGRLVWRFCLQSANPSEPFHEIVHNGAIGYMDTRGRIHGELDLPEGRWSGNKLASAKSPVPAEPPSPSEQ